MVRDMLDISGWSHPDSDLKKAKVITWKAADDETLPVEIALNRAPEVLLRLSSLATKMMDADDAAQAILERFVP